MCDAQKEIDPCEWVFRRISIERITQRQSTQKMLNIKHLTISKEPEQKAKQSNWCVIDGSKTVWPNQHRVEYRKRPALTTYSRREVNQDYVFRSTKTVGFGSLPTTSSASPFTAEKFMLLTSAMNRIVCTRPKQLQPIFYINSTFLLGKIEFDWNLW